MFIVYAELTFKRYHMVKNVLFSPVHQVVDNFEFIYPIVLYELRLIRLSKLQISITKLLYVFPF